MSRVPGLQSMTEHTTSCGQDMAAIQTLIRAEKLFIMHTAMSRLEIIHTVGYYGKQTKGVINEDGSIGGSFTNHPGVCDFQGHSYLFYHTTELPGGCGDGAGSP